MKGKSNLVWLSAVIAMMGCGSAYAEDTFYELDPVIVTAQRMETTDLKTPASVETITSEDIKNLVQLRFMKHCGTAQALLFMRRAPEIFLRGQ